MALRNPMVQVEIMNTPAIFMANKFTSASIARRPRYRVALSDERRLPAATAPIRAPINAAAANRHATNSNPLPRNTVAKNLSSSSPKRFRSTPMNHRNAIPANGTRASAKRTACPAVWIGEPNIRLRQISRDRVAGDSHPNDHQHRKNHARDCRPSRGHQGRSGRSFVRTWVIGTKAPIARVCAA